MLQVLPTPLLRGVINVKPIVATLNCFNLTLQVFVMLEQLLRHPSRCKKGDAHRKGSPNLIPTSL